MSELCMGPYQRHYYRLGSVIRNTVSQAQDSICRLYFTPFLAEIREQAKRLDEDGKYIAFLTGAREDYVWPEPPQSLGELCIELAQEEISYSGPVGCFGYTGIVGEPGEPIYEYRFCPYVRRRGPIDVSRDIQKLRETLYHKHTKPVKERKTG